MKSQGWRPRFARQSLGSTTAKALGAAARVNPLLAVLLVCGALLGLIMVLGAVVSVANPTSGEDAVVCRIAGSGEEGPPQKLLPIYRAATEKYKLGARGPSILAAINFVETNFGTNMGPSSAGAEGWMQFMPETWETYGVDANEDGVKDPSNPWDAIFAAARYLRASGAPGDWHGAIFAYNHAEWYVEEVMEAAAKYDGDVVCTTVPSSPLGELPAGAPQRIGYVARWIESKRIHYCWGGGHAARPGPDPGDYCWNAAGTERIHDPSLTGLDCSGAVRWLLVLTGYDDPGPLSSGDFAGAYPSGPGRYVTIWSNAEHVFVTINGHGWGTSESNFAHGPGFAEHTTAGFVASHPPGL
jgi:hypothetical protein